MSTKQGKFIKDEKRKIFIGGKHSQNEKRYFCFGNVNVRVLTVRFLYRGDKIRIICEPPVTLSSNPDQAAAIQEDTQKLTGYVERWIREDPAQWLWLHNRWKRRPLMAGAVDDR